MLSDRISVKYCGSTNADDMALAKSQGMVLVAKKEPQQRFESMLPKSKVQNSRPWIQDKS